MVMTVEMVAGSLVIWGDSMVTRRELLRTTGWSIATGAGYEVASVYTSPLSVQDRLDYIPSDSTISFDRAWLERYKPKLVLTDEDTEKLLGLYGWRVSSPNKETDAAVYWASYSHQEGVTSYDSHRGDHEPIVVFVDSETGEPDQVAASVYHWLKGLASYESVPRTGDRIVLDVISPWHHYTAGNPALASDVDLFSLGTGEALRDPERTTEFGAWVAGGLADDLAPVVVNPWDLLRPERGSWWQDGFLASFGFSPVTEQRIRFAQWIGEGVAGNLTADRIK